MDISPFLELSIAPRAVFDSLKERGSRVRFMLPTPQGDWNAITWNAFATQIRNVALYLAASGLKATERGAVFGHNSVAWGASALGIQAASGAIVPIYPASTPDQAAYIAAHCDARFLFIGQKAELAKVFRQWAAYEKVERFVLLDESIDPARVIDDLRAQGHAPPRFADVETRIVPWERVMQVGAASHADDPKAIDRLLSSVSLDQTGMMLYTSGTSGNPKGVPLTHRNVAVNGRDWLLNNAPLIDENAIDILWLPMSHIFGFGEMCLGNTLGFTTYMSDPGSCLGELPKIKPNVFMSVPAYWEKLFIAAEGNTDKLMSITGGRLRFCLSGGAGLKREVKEFFHRAGILIIEGYGLTETAPTLTLNRPDAFRFDTVGKPLPSVELRLAEDGEILARGPNVFSGYHKDPIATREAFTEDGWFKTGDVGRFTEDGYLQIVDRKKDILVTAGGKNVPPANIEIRFRDDPFLSNVVVYGDGKRFLVAGVWLNEAAVEAHLRDAQVNAEGRIEARRALVQRRIDAVNAELASFETIKKFVILDTPLTVEGGLLTSSLKVRRKQVYETFRASFEGLYEAEKPAAPSMGANA